MSTTYYASVYDTIPEASVAATSPEALAAFFQAVDAVVAAGEGAVDRDEVLCAFARETLHGDRDYQLGIDAESMQPIEAAYAALTDAFAKDTNLSLHIGYAGSGLSGSDLCNERFWYLGNADIPNPARLAFEARCACRTEPAFYLDAG